MYSKYHEPTFHQPGLNPHILNSIATFFANVTNNLYCVHNSVTLLSHYLEALTTCYTYRRLVSSPKNPLLAQEAMISLVPAVMPKTMQGRHADRYFG
jgi:hypothetical protein